MRLVVFADIHIGAIKDSAYVYHTMTDIIDKEIIFQHTDAVIVAGDYFDKVFKANEENVSLAINVMSYLIRACSREKTKIRIIYGTESHEMSQYRLFNYHMTSKSVDIKLFTTVSEEELFPEINVLYIPEEYIQDKQTHYKDTLYAGKHYTYIFGHGVIIEGMPGIISRDDSVKSKELKVPHFKSKELTSVSDMVVFGHYHIRTDIGDNAYYVGSLFRWKFGEEPPKGYAVITDNQFEFVENPAAWVYRTYDYSAMDPIYKSEEEIHREIEKIRTENPSVFEEEFHGKIRMRFTLPRDFDPTFRDKLMAVIAKDRRFVPMFTNLGDDVLMEEVKDEVREQEELQYVIDPNVKIKDKISRFASERYDTQLPAELVEKYVKVIS